MDHKYLKSSKFKHNLEARNLLDTLLNKWQLPAIYAPRSKHIGKEFVIVNIYKVHEQLIHLFYTASDNKRMGKKYI